MSSMLFLGYAALGIVLGVATTFVAERERKRGASRWSWVALWAFGLVLISFGFSRLTVMVYS